MATDTLNGTSGTIAWDVGANWSLGSVPASGDAAVIMGGASSYLTVTIAATDPAYTVASLTENTANTAPGAATLNVAGRLSVTGNTALSSGAVTLYNNAVVTLGSVTLSNSAQISENGSGSPSLTIGSVTAGSSNGGSILVSTGTATIGTIAGGGAASVSLSLRSTTATVGSSDGTAFYDLNNGRLNLQSAATSLADTVTPGNNTTNLVDLTAIGYQLGETSSTTLLSSSVFNTYRITLTSALGQVLYTFQKVTGVGAFNAQVAPSVSVQSDGAGGTLVTLACYVAGTLIAVPGGELAVEALAIGDTVMTASGGERVVKWVGRRSYAGRFLQSNARARPIRFRAGSLGEGVPRRDLLVSPEHAMAVAGVLVPARCLVNGASVVQDDAVGEVSYFHVELDSHDLLLAEGAASESFVDDNSRMIFHNAAEFAARYPQEAAGRVAAAYCLPRVEDGEVLVAVRAAVDRRAGLRAPAAALRGRVDGLEAGVLHGWAQDPAWPEAPVCLEVRVDGVAVREVVADGFRADLVAAGLGSGRHSFRVRLPRGTDARRVEVCRMSDGALLPVAAERLAA